MAEITNNARVCEICGSTIETTSAGDLGCIACLIGTGLDAETEQNDTAIVSPPDRLGAYTIEHHADGGAWELGHGAMGVTYRAIDKALDRPVALKIINTDARSHSAEARERFMREARAAAALRHPNVATVYQFGVREETGQFFYAMELVEGETLEERVRRLGPLDVLTTIDIASQVTAALEAAEQRGLVHRDLKPGNLMLVGGCENSEQVGRALRARRERTAQRAVPTVKVIDFGVAKAVAEKPNAMLLTHGGFVGTPAFASPEQFTNAPVDVRSDIYSLGVTLWFLLTGNMLFGGSTIEEIQNARRVKPLPVDQLKAAHVPNRFVSLLVSMLAIEPAARPAGARQLSARLQAIRDSIVGRKKTAARVALATVIVALATVVAVREFRSTRAPAAIPDKSIAVLPFENLSADPENAYFAEGMQEEILTRLASIADLKVISRASSQRYRSKPRNLAAIAKELGVANILEGTVQKAADQVRVNVQLINVQTDSHLWAETYDQKLTDVFSVESGIARRVADSLQAKLTGREVHALAAKPTNNPEAYDAYLRGLVYSLKASSATPANALSAQKYLREAVRLDPKFALAWAWLSFVDGQGYLNQHLQPTVTLREEAAQAAQTALTLQPNLGEAVLAKGYYHYACLRDYDSAVRYFEQARHLLPNSSWLSELLAKVTRRRGQWDESESHFNEAERLDPRNGSLLVQHALSYVCLRRFREALRKLDEALNITPDDVTTVANKASIAQAQDDLRRASALLAPLRPSVDHPSALESQVYQSILERQPQLVIPRLLQILAEPNPTLGYLNGELRFCLGWAQEVAGDHVAAQESWRRARSELEPLLKEQPENYNVSGNLALIDASLGDKAAAFALAEQAMAVLPVERDAVSGAIPIEILARVAAQMGEPDRAITALQKLLSLPYEGAFDKGVPLTPALLRLDPMFDPLRSDPRFQKLCEENVDKSIAVLPFENLSRDPDNAYFAEGIQEEILTRLAKIAELKVISRASTERYQNKPRDLEEIAKQLGVTNILEGSVQRIANQVRVNVQLINAQTDSHLWAETYDQKLTDLFTVESEIAKRVSESLQAKLTGREEQALGVKPTNNPDAYDAYLRGLAYSLRTFSNTPTNAFGAQKYLREAVRLDPKFALAWAVLSYVDAFSYLALTLQPTVSLREEARLAAETAFTLQPNLGESVLAKGYYHYACLKDYDTATKYFEQARPLLPNSSRVPESLAYITRRRGQWDRSEAYFNEAERLDPRNLNLLFQHAGSYVALRRFPEALRKLDQVLNITPDDMDTLAVKAVIAQAQGDLPRAAAILAPLHPAADNPVALRTQAYQAILERRPEPVIVRLKEILEEPDPTLGYVNGELRFWLGWAQEVGGYHAAAQESWREARSELESFLAEQPDNYNLIGDLALTNMSLGDKVTAFALAKQAIAVLPIEKDAVNGPMAIEIFARVAANMGESERAIGALRKLLSIPYEGPFDIRGQSLTPALLRLDPMFDRLRGDPAFQKLCEEKQP